MRESKIELWVCSYAKSLGWLCYKFASPSNNGVPDRIFFRNGKTVLIEFKANDEKPRKLQEVVIASIRRKGIPVFVVDSIEGGRYVFDSFESA